MWNGTALILKATPAMTNTSPNSRPSDGAPASGVQPESFVRTFVDEGEPVSKLLLELLKQKGKRWESEKPELLHYVVKLKELFTPAGSVPVARTSCGAPAYRVRSSPPRGS